MRAKTLIDRLTKIVEKHGNVDVFTDEGHLVEGAKFETIEEDDYPSDWNMPKKAVILNVNS